MGHTSAAARPTTPPDPAPKTEAKGKAKADAATRRRPAAGARRESGEPRGTYGAAGDSAGARAEISASWARALRHGVDPDGGSAAEPLSAAELAERRRASPLAALLPALRDGLAPAAAPPRHILLVCDAEGRVLWRDGGLAAAGRGRTADRLGFAEGAGWAESSAGTNAIGTALVTGRPLRVHSGEHYVRRLRRWTCAAAPLHDPRDGRLLGVVDVTGPAADAHPVTLSLVSAVARVAEHELRAAHWQALAGLRAIGAPLLARLPGRAVVVDAYGWTAAVTGMPAERRLALPAGVRGGRVWVPSLGACLLEPLPGGWLVRPEEPAADPGGTPPEARGRVVLDVSGTRGWTLAVTGAGGVGGWSVPLSPRHAELLYVLARHPAGRSAAELAADLFGDAGRAVTVRAELSRLRRRLGGVLEHRPYRFAESVRVEVRGPADPAALLPTSRAPAIRRDRERPARP
jgi:hypothetical protein